MLALLVEHRKCAREPSQATGVTQLKQKYVTGIDPAVLQLNHRIAPVTLSTSYIEEKQACLRPDTKQKMLPGTSLVSFHV